MQAPGGPEEDPSNGFTQGGWAMSYVDEAARKVTDDIMAGEFDMLLGRRTYDIFASYWPHQGNLIAKAFNKATQYVVTRRADGLDWKASKRIDERRRRARAAQGIGRPGAARQGQWPIAPDAERGQPRRRIPPLGLSRGARHRKAAVRERRPATDSVPGCSGEHANGRPLQHLQVSQPRSKRIDCRSSRPCIGAGRPSCVQASPYGTDAGPRALASAPD